MNSTHAKMFYPLGNEVVRNNVVLPPEMAFLSCTNPCYKLQTSEKLVLDFIQFSAFLGGAPSRKSPICSNGIANFRQVKFGIYPNMFTIE